MDRKVKTFIDPLSLNLRDLVNSVNSFSKEPIYKNLEKVERELNCLMRCLVEGITFCRNSTTYRFEYNKFESIFIDAKRISEKLKELLKSKDENQIFKSKNDLIEDITKFVINPTFILIRKF